MAFFEMKIHSDALGHGVSVDVVIPQAAETIIGTNAKAESTYKTLWLLHGLSDDHTGWMRRTSIERYADDHGIAVVMPFGGRSWYTDTAYGAKYFTFITEELPNICRTFFRGMSAAREDNFIGGNSMGGYGAMKAALTYPDRYFGCIPLSGAFDIEYMARVLVADEWRQIFGMNDTSELIGSKHDVFHLARETAKSGETLPKIFMWCGDDDFIRDSSEKMTAVLDECGIPHVYERSAGGHSWDYWDEYIRRGIGFMLG